MNNAKAAEYGKRIQQTLDDTVSMLDDMAKRYPVETIQRATYQIFVQNLLYDLEEENVRHAKRIRETLQKMAGDAYV